MFFSCIKRKAICLMMMVCIFFFGVYVCVKQIFSSENNTGYKSDVTKISSLPKTIEYVDI